MKKRIGNDIRFSWHIYRKDGDTQVPESFAGKDVEVKLISPLQRPVTIEDVSIATGVVTFTFRGKHQVTLGNYVAVLLENKGENGMVTLDVVDAVTLVPHSYMEEDGDEGDVIEATSVELTSSIIGGMVQQQADWAQTDASAVDYIKNKPDLGLYLQKTDSDGHGNMSIYGQGTITMTLADEQGSVNQIGTFYAGGWSVSSLDGKFQTFGNSIYRGTIGIDEDSVVWEKTATQQIPAATSEKNGLMSAEDKGKLNDLPTATELAQELESKANSDDLAEVARSGSYNDLSDKPTIPTVPTNVSALNNDAGYITDDDVDDVPTANSDNPVKSGGVYDAVKDTVKNTRPDLSDRFSVADPNGYIGFEIDKNGNLLSPTIEALKSQVPNNIDKRYNDTFIISDSEGNIAFVIDKNGNILSKSIDDCGKNPFRTKSLYTIGDSLFCSNVWQETCAQALGCLYDANVNTNPEYPTSAGGTNSYMKYMLSTYMRVLNLIKQDVIPNQGKDAIIILGNSNDNIFEFNTSARAYKCDNIIELPELTTENLASVDVSERSLNIAIKLPQVSIGTILTITQLPVREGDINLNVGWSADGHYDYKIHVVPQATQEETLAYVMERILEYDYGSVFDVKMSDDSVGFTNGGSYHPAVIFSDIGNTGMQVTTSQSDNVTYYMLKWFNSDDITEWTVAEKWVDGSASSGWKSSIEELQRHYPLAHIAILNCPKIVINMADSSMIRPNGTYNQEAFADAILHVIEGVTKRNKDIADFYKVKFIDIWSELGVSANNVLSFYLASGNVHTNKQGQQRWGELIAGAIKGWIL